jgi:hypothetical protein
MQARMHQQTHTHLVVRALQAVAAKPKDEPPSAAELAARVAE